MATKASRIALAGSNISSTGEVDADLLDNIDSAAFLSLDGNGRLGIGTNNPERPLHVKGANAFIRVESTSTSQNSQLDIKSTAATWSIGQNQVVSNTGTLEFYNGSSSPVVIKSNGNVGIGTTNPSQIFEVQKAADDKLVYGSNPRLLLDTPTGINGLRVLGDTTPFEFKIDSGTYNGSAFQMGGTGDVSLIGTTTTASDTFNDSPTFFFNSMRWNGSANSTHFQGAIKGHTRSATNGDGYLGIGANANANHLNIDASSGNVGIGASSPSAVFHVNRSTYSSTERTVKINNGGNNGGAQYDTLLINQPDVPSVRLVETATNQEVTLSVGNENSNSAVIGSTGQLVFSVGRAASTLAYSAGGRAMTINSTGNVGIGRTSPQSKLDVLSAVRVTSAANTSHSLKLEARSDFANDGDSALIWISDGGASSNPLFTSQGAHLVIEGRKSAARHIYYKVGNTTTAQHSMMADGRMGIGTLSPSERLHVSGNILATGTVSGNSDISLKDNITPIPDALDKVLQIRGVTFNRNDIEDNPRQAGVIAQEVEKVLPEVVSEGKDGIK